MSGAELLDRVTEVGRLLDEQRPAFLDATDRLEHAARVVTVGREHFIVCRCGWVSASWLVVPSVVDCAVAQLLRRGASQVEDFRRVKGTENDHGRNARPSGGVESSEQMSEHGGACYGGHLGGQRQSS